MSKLLGVDLGLIITCNVDVYKVYDIIESIEVDLKMLLLFIKKEL